MITGFSNSTIFYQQTNKLNIQKAIYAPENIWRKLHYLVTTNIANQQNSANKW